MSLSAVTDDDEEEEGKSAAFVNCRDAAADTRNWGWDRNMKQTQNKNQSIVTQTTNINNGEGRWWWQRVCVRVCRGWAIMYSFPLPCYISLSLPPTAALMGHNLSFAHCGNWCMWGGGTCVLLPLCVCQRIRKWNPLKSSVCLPSSSNMTHFHYSLRAWTDFSLLWSPAYTKVCNSEDNYIVIHFAQSMQQQINFKVMASTIELFCAPRPSQLGCK